MTLLGRTRSLVYQLVRRDFEQRYVGSAVGWVWGLIHPLVLLGVYTFVFQRFTAIASAARRGNR